MRAAAGRQCPAETVEAPPKYPCVITGYFRPTWRVTGWLSTDRTCARYSVRVEETLSLNIASACATPRPNRVLPPPKVRSPATAGRRGDHVVQNLPQIDSGYACRDVETVIQNVAVGDFEELHLDHHLRAPGEELFEQRLAGSTREIRSRITTAPSVVSQASLSMFVACFTACAISVNSWVVSASGTGIVMAIVCSRSLRFCGVSCATMKQTGRERNHERIRHRFQIVQRFPIIDARNAKPDLLARRRIVAIVNRLEPEPLRNLIEHRAGIAADIEILRAGSRFQLRQSLRLTGAGKFARGDAVENVLRRGSAKYRRVPYSQLPDCSGTGFDWSAARDCSASILSFSFLFFGCSAAASE